MVRPRNAPTTHNPVREDEAPPLVNHTKEDSRAVSSALAAADIDAISPGARLGRYMVIEVVGSGGIGIVYSAYDPDLDRRVALKLLRRSKLTGGVAAVNQRRGRLRREALALARLSHPNVVPIYEVATVSGLDRGEDQIYVVMEFVEGSTLGEWLRERARSWAEIIALFIQAGRGLAAAHAADIVHRDFKPDNVRVGTDGRVRVLDFGLAGPLREGDSELSRAREHERGSRRDPSDRGSSDPSELTREDAVTRDGQVMGTPAYMAPEQATGGQVDARSDQFSFCVALYEAIYGERPFTGRYDDPRRFIDLSRTRSLPGCRPPDLPNEIERVILRGLSLEPDNRFDDIDGLLTGLSAVGEGPRRLWWVPASLLFLATVAIVAYERESSAEITCDDGQASLQGVWDPAVAYELRTAVLASTQPYAQDTWTTVEHSLNHWAERWQRARLRACEATHVHGGQSLGLLERRVACLDRQLIRVESMTAGLRRLEQRPDELLERLTPMLDRVPSPETCAAANVLERSTLEPSPEPSARAAQTIREQLAMIEGLADVGELEQAIERGHRALALARDLDFEPITAEALLTLGLVLDQQPTERGVAAELLTEAAWAAQRSGHERTLVRAAAALAGNLSAASAQLEVAEVWAELARASFVRLGDDPEVEIELRTHLGHLAMVRGEYLEALKDNARARELAAERGEGHPNHLRTLLAAGDSLRELGRYEEAAAVLELGLRLAAIKLGPQHPMVPELLDALGNVEAARARWPEALDLHRRALEVNVLIHGPTHRSVAKNLNNMAIIFDETGRYAESVETLERARAILVDIVGADHFDVAFVDVNLGSALQNLGRHGDAMVRYEAALGVLEASLGPEHMAVGVTLQNLGSARAGRLDHAAALDDYARSARVLEQAFGEQHPSVADLELNRARSFRALGRYEEALAADQRALAIREEIFGSDHPRLVEILADLSETELALDHPERALAVAEQALKIVSDSNTAIEHASAELALARALVANSPSKRERTRAQELARAALARLAKAEGGEQLRARVSAWLREQGASD